VTTTLIPVLSAFAQRHGVSDMVVVADAGMLSAANLNAHGYGQVTIDRARRLAGLKGYVTNLPASSMDGAAVIAAYHDLWRVKQSFRMTKGDLRARPVFHHQREAIEAHLTVVFAALAVARHLQDAARDILKRLEAGH
jgi:hypothetical protein